MTRKYTWEQPEAGGSFTIGEAARIELPPRAVTAGATITATEGTPGVTALPEMEPAGPALQIEVVGGTLTGPATLHFAVSTPAQGEIPIIATWNGTTWVPAGGTYDPVISSITIVTEHLSWWQPWTWNIGKVVTAAFNGLFGDVDTSEMACGDTPLGTGYRVALTENGDAFSGCATTSADQITVTVKNRRRGAFIIELPAGFSGQVRDALDFSAMLTESLFNITSRTFVVIPGGETADITGTIGRGTQVSMPVGQDLFSWSIDTMLYAASVFSLGGKAAGATDTLSSVIRQSEDKISWMRDALGCLGGNSAWINAAVTNPSSPAAAEDLVPTIWECAKAYASDGGAVSVISKLAELALTPIRQIFKLGEMAVDLASARDDRRLLIARDNPPANLDLSNAPVPSLCGHPAGNLVNGSLPLNPAPDGSDVGHVTLRDVRGVGDIDGDGQPETAAAFGCNQGGIGWPEWIVVYHQDLTVAGAVDTAEIPAQDDPVWPVWRSVISAITWRDGRFYVDVSYEISAMEPTQDRVIEINAENGALTAAMA
jgi:hypothetical protein